MEGLATGALGVPGCALAGMLLLGLLIPLPLAWLLRGPTLYCATCTAQQVRSQRCRRRWETAGLLPRQGACCQCGAGPWGGPSPWRFRTPASAKHTCKAKKS